MSRKLDLGAHIDPVKKKRTPVEAHRLTHHYTPLGSGVARIARVKCEPEELVKLSSYKMRKEVQTDLLPDFNRTAEKIIIVQGDVVAFTATGQLAETGEPILPLMHKFETTSRQRLAIPT